MKPLDPRLLRHARSARRYVAWTSAGGVATAVLVVLQCFVIAQLVAPVVVAHSPGRTAGATVLPLLDLPASALMVLLAGVFAARVVVIALQEAFAHRAARDAVAELRAAVLEHAAALGPRWIGSTSGAQTATLVTRGLDDLEPYVVRYLPQLVLAAVVTPVALVVVLTQDLVSALTIAFALPLIPLFMALIGRLTQSFATTRLETMQRLGAQLLDLLAGLTTLVNLGRERGPATRVAQLGRAYTATTMSTLRVAFLSSAVLEFLTSLSVALVAVGVGMRLVYGEVDLTTGLLCITLAPEVFKPVREVGTQFHAAADGVAAAERAFDVLETPAPAPGTAPAPDLTATDIVLSGVTVHAPGRGLDAPAALDMRVRRGEITALVGASGAGKSTTALVVLGLLRPDAGCVRLVPATGGGGVAPVADPGGVDPGGVDPSHVVLGDVEPGSWWAQLAWVPQRPVLLPGTVRENAGADVAPGALEAAARATGLDRVVASLPRGWDTRVGQGGLGLSVGQRQRVALTRALATDAALVVLDEPTAHLDAAAEEDVLAAVRELRARGRTVLVVAHRASLVSLADQVVTVSCAATPEPPEPVTEPGRNPDAVASSGSVAAALGPTGAAAADTAATAAGGGPAR